MIESFEQANALDRGALEALLASGRPEQRIWAIWALALRTGEGAQIGRGVAREPDPGVRRTLAVMLASHGETELLLALARHDPAMVVRESAMQLAARLAVGGGVKPQDVIALANEPAPQLALLGAIGPGAPAAFVELVFQLARSGSPVVQLEALEALLRIDTQPTRDAARTWLLRQESIVHACDRWLRAANVESLAEALVGSRAELRLQALTRVRAAPWSAVRRLVGDDPKLLRVVLTMPDVVIPADVLSRAILAGSHAGFVERLAAKLAAAALGRALLGDLRAAIELSDDDGTVLRDLHTRAKRYADGLDVPDAIALLDELASHHPVEHLLGLENAVTLWLSDVDAPPALVPQLPELHRYCTRHLATLQPSPPRVRRALGAPQSYLDVAPPWDEYGAFRDLVEALARLLPSR